MSAGLPRPCRGGAAHALPKYKFRVKFHAMLSQQGHKLLLETHLSMMRRLISYIPLHHRQIRRTDTKCAVAFLPFDLLTSFMRPSRRLKFRRNHLEASFVAENEVNDVLHVGVRHV